MVVNERQWSFFAAGLFAGAVAAAAVIWGLRLLPASGSARPSAATPQVVSSGPRQGSACAFDSVMEPASRSDGQFNALGDLSANSSADAPVFIKLGQEASAAGRLHDAEVAFLMSCRVAARFLGPDSVQAADAKYQLGRHYATVAAQGPYPAGAKRTELLKRAELLYADSVREYVAGYGQAHEKTRFAAEGLAAVRQTLAQAPNSGAAPGLPPAREAAIAKAQPAPPPQKPPQPAVVAKMDPAPPQSSAAAAAKPAAPASAATAPPPSAVASVPKPPPRQAEVAKSAPREMRSPTASRSGPSFNCRRARSVNERIICADPQLARLDRDLGRLYARAKVASGDPAGFKLRQNSEWRNREAVCRDRECLLRWYAQRRDQLMAEIYARQARRATASR